LCALVRDADASRGVIRTVIIVSVVVRGDAVAGAPPRVDGRRPAATTKSVRARVRVRRRRRGRRCRGVIVQTGRKRIGA
jgi:hypothetical protein